MNFHWLWPHWHLLWSFSAVVPSPLTTFAPPAVAAGNPSSRRPFPHFARSIPIVNFFSRNLMPQPGFKWHIGRSNRAILRDWPRCAQIFEDGDFSSRASFVTFLYIRSVETAYTLKL